MEHTGGHNIFDLNSGFDMRVQYDGSGRQLYIGIATPGSADADDKFQIFKLAYDGSGRVTHRRFPNGDDTFDKKWTLRTTYDYLDI